MEMKLQSWGFHQVQRQAQANASMAKTFGISDGSRWGNTSTINCRDVCVIFTLTASLLHVLDPICRG
jgi:hypothetical protein